MFTYPSFLDHLPNDLPHKTTPVLKQKVPPDTVMLSQQTRNTLFILHEGSLKSYFPLHDQFFSGLSIQQAGYFGFESFLNPEANTPILVTDSPSVISTYPLPDLLSLFKKNIDTYLAFMTQLNYQIEGISQLTNQMTKELNNLRLFNIQISHVIKYSGLISNGSLYQKFIDEEQLEEEETHSLSFLHSNLDTYYKFDLVPSRKNYLVAEIFTPTVVQDLIPMLKKNLNITQLIHQIFFQDLERIEQKLGQQAELMAQEMNHLFNLDNGFVEEVKQQSVKIDVSWKKTLKSLYRLIQERIIENDFIKKYFETDHYIQHIDGEMFDPTEEIEAEAETTPMQDKDEVLEEEQPLLGEPEPIEGEGTESLNISLTEVEIIKKLQAQEEASREDIRYLTSLNEKFINNFAQVIVKQYINQEKLSPTEDMLISLGVLDKIFLSSNELKFVNNHLKKYYSTSNILTLEKWMAKIAEGEVPSNDEFGITYQKNLHNEEHAQRLKNITPTIKSEQELLIDKVQYEMQHVIKPNIRTLNQNKRALYGINFTTIPEEPEPTLVQAYQIEDLLTEIISCDPTLFFRETVLTLENNSKKLVELEVLPIVIILPTVGNRIVCWQEYSENNKKTPARFFIPLFFTEDLRTAFIEAMGVFRWELNRRVKGSFWQDSVDGGITGAYIDYLSFYKNNHELSKESKDKLDKFIKSNRKNKRKMFCQNYYEWIEQERTGLTKFHPYLRNLFFKHIPFGKEIRKNLHSLPNYNRLIDAYEARSKKSIVLLNRQYKKFQDPTGKLPQAFEDHLKLFDR